MQKSVISPFDPSAFFRKRFRANRGKIQLSGRNRALSTGLKTLFSLCFGTILYDSFREVLFHIQLHQYNQAFPAFFPTCFCGALLLGSYGGSGTRSITSSLFSIECLCYTCNRIGMVLKKNNDIIKRFTVF